MSKTTFKEKTGYGIASMGDSIGYSLTGTFLMFFLTTIAGINPATAGTISVVGALWNAIINPVIGYMSDKVNTKYGRRRPLIFLFSIPLMLTMFLLFTNINIAENLKPVYYGVLLMLYWTSYTGFVVPYLALGADYTSDYDDRTVLRLFGSFFNMIGSMIAMVMPTMMVEIFQGVGMTADRAWSMTAFTLGLVTLISNVITVIASKDKDKYIQKHIEKKEKFSAADLFKEYISIAKLKPMKYLVVASLSALIGYTMIISNMVYYFTYNMNLSSVEISFVMFVRTVLAIVMIPVVGKAILYTDRRETLIASYLIGMIGLVIIRAFDFSIDVNIIIYIVFATLSTSIYWQVMPGVFYDICEYDRIENGKQRAASIVSFQGLLEAVAAGIGGQLLGIILEIAGFDGASEVQSAGVLTWIENSGTVIPILFFVITCVALYKYPLNKKVYNEMLKKVD